MPVGERLTCQEYAERYLMRYERDHKRSSYDAARSNLKRFLEDFGQRPLNSIERHEAEGNLAGLSGGVDSGVDDPAIDRPLGSQCRLAQEESQRRQPQAGALHQTRRNSKSPGTTGAHQPTTGRRRVRASRRRPPTARSHATGSRQTEFAVAIAWRHNARRR